jgi:predicted dehydrogenase
VTTIRWGMIGCGDVAEVKSGPGFYKARDSALVAVMRRNGALAADYARRHGVARWHDDAEAVIAAPDIDAIYIATLTDSHRDYTLRCAASGKAVYVEKPMAMNPAECREMITACAEAGVKLWVGYYRRALPRFLKVRDLVADGAIGAVRLVRSQQFARLPAASAFAGAVPWRVDPALSGGGFFFEAVCHTFDSSTFCSARSRICTVSPAIRQEPGGQRIPSSPAIDSPRASSAAALGAMPPTMISR